jgi:hypothetical protein
MARLAPYDLVTCAYVLEDLVAQLSGSAPKRAGAGAGAPAEAPGSSGNGKGGGGDGMADAFKADVARARAANAARAQVDKSNAASELAQQSVAATVAVALWGCVAPGGLLVLVEPGDKAGAMRLQAARHALLSAYALPPAAAAAAAGGTGAAAKRAAKQPTASVVAPCTHHLACPFAPGAPKSALETLVVGAGAGELNEGNANGGGRRRSGTRQRRGDESRGSGFGSSGGGGEGGGELSAAASGWCRFVQRVPRERPRGGPHADERFSYLVLHKSDPAAAATAATAAAAAAAGSSSSSLANAAPGSDKDHGDSGDDDGSRGSDDASWLEAEQAAALAAVGAGGRLLRTPLKRAGHVVLDVCRPATAASPGTPDGAAARAAAGKGDGPAAAAEFAAVERRVVSRAKHPALFAAARKASWGGTWPSDEAPLWRLGKPPAESSAEELYAKWYGPKGLALPRAEVKRRVAAALVYRQEDWDADKAAVAAAEAADQATGGVGGRRRGRQRSSGTGKMGGGDSAERDDDGGMSEIEAFLKRVQASEPNALDGVEGLGKDDPYTVDLLSLNQMSKKALKPKKPLLGLESDAGASSGTTDGEKPAGGRKGRARFMSKRLEK